MHDNIPTFNGLSSHNIELRRSSFKTVGLRQNWKPLVSDSENLKGSFVYWKLWAHSNSGTATKELLLIAAGYGN